MSHEKFISICIELASKGLGSVAPNPMVGCVIVHNHIIIGEGLHEKYGEAHAEVNAINSVHHKSLLKESTLYVNLEPCSHFGKTAPCSDLIIENKIPYVVIACVDSNSLVKGKGIERLIKAGVDVKVGILEKESRQFNKRFFTFHEKKRPYIILKWAQSADGFIARLNNEKSETASYISCEESLKLVHQWRNEEQAIMVGTQTVLADNPRLTVRHVKGKNPTRIIFDRNLIIKRDFEIYDKSGTTIVFNEIKSGKENNIEFIKKYSLKDVMKELIAREIQSVIVEGGTKLIESFKKENLWDEMRVITSDVTFGNGVEAPFVSGKLFSETIIDHDKLSIYNNN